MGFLRKVLKLDDPQLERKAVETEREIESVRQEYRQAIQRTESGVRVMNTWNGAMKMLRDQE